MPTEWEEVELEDGSVTKIPKGLTDEQASVYLKSNAAISKPEPKDPMTWGQMGMKMLPDSPVGMVGNVASGVGQGITGMAGMAAGPLDIFMKLLTNPKEALTSLSAGSPGSKTPSPDQLNALIDEFSAKLNSPSGVPDKVGMFGRILGDIIPGVMPINDVIGSKVEQSEVGQALGMLMAPGAVMKGAKAAKATGQGAKAGWQAADKGKIGHAGIQAIQALMASLAGYPGIAINRTGSGANSLLDSFKKEAPVHEPFRARPGVVRNVSTPAPMPSQTSSSPIQAGKVLDKIKAREAALPQEVPVKHTPYRAKEGVVRNVSTRAPEPMSATKSGPVKGTKVSSKIEKRETMLAKKAAARYKETQAKKPKVKLPQPKIEKKETSSLAAPGWERIIRNAKGQFMRAEESA